MAPRWSLSAPLMTLVLLLVLSSQSTFGQPLHRSYSTDLHPDSSDYLQDLQHVVSVEGHEPSEVPIPESFYWGLGSQMIDTADHSAPLEFPIQPVLDNPPVEVLFSALDQNGHPTLAEDGVWRNVEGSPFMLHRRWRRKRTSQSVRREEMGGGDLIGPVDLTSIINAPNFRTTPRSNRRKCPSGQQADMTGRCRVSFG